MTSAPSDTPNLGEAPRVDDPEGRRAKASVAAALFGDPAPGPPVLADRYQLGRRLGAGGMGVVYEAHDPQLDRPVAVKLLHPEASADARARARMVREARALARLSHPHVIQVYDVGDDGTQVFVAMELVDGETLGRRARALREAGDWRGVLGLYLDAGRGLQAAHEAGLVHRDFKPDNVLVGEDGRARVLDFGLARRATVEAPPAGGVTREEAGEAQDGVTHSLAGESATALTRAGAVVGTPRYMSPEQLAGEPADAAADQFSFCVAVYEGLYGTHPFGGASVGSLADLAAARDDDGPRPPDAGPVPGRVFDVLSRGLAPAPAQRWPDLGALLDALERAADQGDRGRRSGRWVAAALGVAALGVLAASLVGLGLGARDPTGRGTAVAGGDRSVADSAPAPGATVDEGEPEGADPAGSSTAGDAAIPVDFDEPGEAQGEPEGDDETGGSPVVGTAGTSSTARPRADWCHLHEDSYRLLQRGRRGLETLEVDGACYTCRVESRKSRTQRFTPRCGAYRLCGPAAPEKCG